MPITKEERQSYLDYSKKLKKYLQKKLDMKLSVTVSSSVRPNPYIRVIPIGAEVLNDFRLEIMDALGWEPLNRENVSYGNIQSNRISLVYSSWVEVVGDLLKK